VRLSALEHNYSEVESVANRQQCSVIVVVKADGYGHGAIPTALYLADKIGADAFAVATLQEGIALRKAIQETAAAAAATTITTNNNNDNAINYYFNLNNKLNQTSAATKRLRWHALVDSGMGRLGFRTDPVSKEDQGKRRDSVEILKELVDLEVNLDCPIEFYGMCTHMADASNSTSTYTNSQINKFTNLLKRVRNAGISVPTISTDNSAALLTTNLTHFDSKELLTQTDANSRGFVRTGGAIYGQRPTFSQLRAVSTLMASVRHVAILKEGESVGYDRAYVAPMNSRIATLTIGFADGYPRELGNGIGRVSIRGHLFPVAGNVCMDMLMVELGPAGDKEGIGAQVVVGDTAILWGPDDGEEGEGHVRLQDLAAILKTTQSALTCGLNKERVLRQY
ncbi:alanine racemase C-terminal domain-like protein, partial [Fragilariopsis cylindrus CCMP1102]